MLKAVTLESLKDFDFGKPSVAFDLELKRAVLDCIDRPTEGAARTVSLEVSVIPATDGKDCEGAHVKFKVKSKIPTRQTRSYHLMVNQKGRLIFNEDSPENADQTTIFDKEPSPPQLPPPVDVGSHEPTGLLTHAEPNEPAE